MSYYRIRSHSLLTLVCVCKIYDTMSLISFHCLPKRVRLQSKDFCVLAKITDKSYDDCRGTDNRTNPMVLLYIIINDKPKTGKLVCNITW